VFRTVCHDKQLVACMELDEAPEGGLASYELPPSFEDKNALDEVLAQPRVVQPPLVLYGYEGKPFHERRREDAHPPVDGRA